MKLDDMINKIKPYFLSLRYKDNMTIVDVKLKEGWKVPKSKLIACNEYDTHPNTYIFYPIDKSVGADDIIDFVGEIIKINIEREKKMELLSIKKNELTTFFGKYSYKELLNLKFVINDEEEFDIPLTESEPTKEYSEEEIKDIEVNEPKEIKEEQ